MVKRVLSVLFLLMTPLLGASAPVSAASLLHPPRLPITHQTSSNWAGYVVDVVEDNSSQSNAVGEVSGTWTVPTLSCSSTNSYSAAWVGIDGFTDRTVEQIGTEQDCVNGTPTYAAWFETYPRPTRLPNLTIKPGDTITAKVQYVDRNLFTLSLSDSNGGSFSTTVHVKAQRQSAEWIVEAPAVRRGTILPLADFSSITFSNASATLDGQNGPISNSSWQAITMQTPGGTLEAVPSSLTNTNSGSSFSVTWKS